MAASLELTIKAENVTRPAARQELAYALRALADGIESAPADIYLSWAVRGTDTVQIGNAVWFVNDNTKDS